MLSPVFLPVAAAVGVLLLLLLLLLAILSVPTQCR